MANERVTMGRRILTKAVLATIPEMVAQGGMRADDIAEKLGCNLGTLKVRCSQAKISLRPPGSRRGRPRIDERTIRLSGDALALLQRRAAASGKTETALARQLLETIARDDLYDAVLDDEPVEPLPMKKRAFGETNLTCAKGLKADIQARRSSSGRSGMWLCRGQATVPHNR